MADIDLSAVPIADLAAEIERRDNSDYRLIGDDEALLSDASVDDIREAAVECGLTILDEDDGEYVHLDEARSYLGRGDLRECLYAIERELPHEFSGLTEMVFRASIRRVSKAALASNAKLPKHVQQIIDTVRRGQVLCCHKRLNHKGTTERSWFFEPSGKPVASMNAEAAVATTFLQPCGDGLFANQSQTFRAAP